MNSTLRKAAGMDTKSQASEENCRQFLVEIMKKFYPVTRLKFFQSLNMKLPQPMCANWCWQIFYIPVTVGASRFSVFLLRVNSREKREVLLGNGATFGQIFTTEKAR